MHPRCMHFQFVLQRTTDVCMQAACIRTRTAVLASPTRTAHMMLDEELWVFVVARLPEEALAYIDASGLNQMRGA